MSGQTDIAKGGEAGGKITLRPRLRLVLSTATLLLTEQGAQTKGMQCYKGLERRVGLCTGE